MSKNKISVLITGGFGYIGSHIAKMLVQQGMRPVIFNRGECKLSYIEQNCDIVTGDIRDTYLLIETIKEHEIEMVIHLGASISVPESLEKPELYYENNVGSTLSVLKAMVATGVKNIVFSSTAAVYGVPKQALIYEDFDTKPINPYGQTKLMCEKMIHDLARAHDLKYVVFRYFNAVGSDPDGDVGSLKAKPSNLFPLAMLAAMGKIDKLDIYGRDYNTHDGTAISDYIHVNDLARAHLAALPYLMVGGDNVVLNLGTGRGHSVMEVIEMVEEISGKKVAYENAPRRKGDPEKTIAVSDKAEKLLNWTAQHSLRDMVVDQWAWLEKQAN